MCQNWFCTRFSYWYELIKLAISNIPPFILDLNEAQVQPIPNFMEEKSDIADTAADTVALSEITTSTTSTSANSQEAEAKSQSPFSGVAENSTLFLGICILIFLLGFLIGLSFRYCYNSLSSKMGDRTPIPQTREVNRCFFESLLSIFSFFAQDLGSGPKRYLIKGEIMFTGSQVGVEGS